MTVIFKLQDVANNITSLCSQDDLRDTAGNVIKASNFCRIISGLQMILRKFEERARENSEEEQDFTITSEVCTSSIDYRNLSSKCCTNPTSITSSNQSDLCKAYVSCATMEPANSIAPLRICEFRRIGPQSVLLKWTVGRSKLIKGYEIIINGVIKNKVHSRIRTSCVVDDVDFHYMLYVEIYARTETQRCLPPATFKYDPENPISCYEEK